MTVELVAGDIEQLKIREVKVGRKGAVEGVVLQVQSGQTRELVEVRRYTASDAVVGEHEPLQQAEREEPFGYLARARMASFPQAEMADELFRDSVSLPALLLCLARVRKRGRLS